MSLVFLEGFVRLKDVLAQSVAEEAWQPRVMHERVEGAQSLPLLSRIRIDGRREPAEGAHQIGPKESTEEDHARTDCAGTGRGLVR